MKKQILQRQIPSTSLNIFIKLLGGFTAGTPKLSSNCSCINSKFTFQVTAARNAAIFSVKYTTKRQG